MIDLLNWVSQDFWHVVGTFTALGLFGDWCINMVKAWRGTKE